MSASLRYAWLWVVGNKTLRYQMNAPEVSQGSSVPETLCSW